MKYFSVFFLSRCDAWVKASQNEKLIGIPASQLYLKAHLCMEHFQDWCFMNSTTKHRLVHNAIPNCDKVIPRKDPAPQVSNILVNNDSQNCSSLRELLTTPVSIQSLPKPISLQTCTFSPIEPSTSHEVFQPDSSLLPLAICSTPKTRSCVSVRKYTPRKQKLAEKMKRCRDTLRQLKHKYDNIKRKNYSAAQSLKTALTTQGVSNKLSCFIQRQVILNTSKKNGRRFTEYDKIYAYRILSKSKAAYRVLKETLELPAEKTLDRFISSKLSYTGISTDVVAALKCVLETKSKHEKMFALVFDEVSLKPCLVYDKSRDCVTGFEDFSGGSRTSNIANHALVLMLRSLTGKEKLPLGFYFSCYAIKADRLHEIIMRALKELNDAGAIVKVLICDQGGNNSRLFKMLGASDSKPFFMFNDNKIFCLFDPPHLLKNLRRNLMKYDLQTSKGLVSFKHIEDFYNIDQKLLVRCAPKLTDAHITASGLNSMKVSLAAQLFSRTVAAGMNMCIMSKLLMPEAAPTVEFVLKFNNLFDSMNGTSKFPLKGKEYHCAVKKGSDHQNLWREMLSFIESWIFVQQQALPASTNKQSPGPRNKFGWLMTIKAMLQLSEEMLINWEYFMTKRCNQDCLENFFSRIRGCGGNRTNPSAYEFSSAFKISAINSFWSKSKFSNCESDEDRFMNLLLTSSSESIKNEKQVVEDEKSEEEIESDYDNCLIDLQDNDEDALENADILSQNTLAFLSGYLSRRVLNILKLTNECDLCQSLLVDKRKPVLQHTMFLHFKEYKDGNTEGGLVYPSVNMTSCIAAFHKIAQSFLSANLSSNDIVGNLRIMLSKSALLNFIDCEIHSNDVKEKIVNFSSLLFLKIHLCEKNREISKCKLDLKQLRTYKKKN